MPAAGRGLPAGPVRAATVFFATVFFATVFFADGFFATVRPAAVRAAGRFPLLVTDPRTFAIGSWRMGEDGPRCKGRPGGA